MLATYTKSEDLIRIGAYKEGMDEDLDRSIRAMPELRRFVEQGSGESVTLAETIARLEAMGFMSSHKAGLIRLKRVFGLLERCTRNGTGSQRRVRG